MTLLIITNGNVRFRHELKDITFISHTHSFEPSETETQEDPDRILERIRHLEFTNAHLAAEIEQIKMNPHSVGLDALGEELNRKIEMLERENEQLRLLFDKNERTPLKNDSVRPSLRTPRAHRKTFSKQTI